MKLDDYDKLFPITMLFALLAVYLAFYTSISQKKNKVAVSGDGWMLYRNIWYMPVSKCKEFERSK
jgi:hypothetical protein